MKQPDLSPLDRRFPGLDNRTYWAALLTVLYGADTAFRVTTAHELSAADQSVEDFGMDMLNNSIGIDLA